MLLHLIGQAVSHYRIVEKLGGGGMGVDQGPSFRLIPVYLRGLAYLRLTQGPVAAAEFQKIIDHSGVVVNSFVGSAAHLALGRALVLSGDSAKARTAYQDFLALWKDADPDVPILQQAKSEYTKLG